MRLPIIEQLRAIGLVPSQLSVRRRSPACIDVPAVKLRHCSHTLFLGVRSGSRACGADALRNVPAADCPPPTRCLEAGDWVAAREAYEVAVQVGEALFGWSEWPTLICLSTQAAHSAEARATTRPKLQEAGHKSPRGTAPTRETHATSRPARRPCTFCCSVSGPAYGMGTLTLEPTPSG